MPKGNFMLSLIMSHGHYEPTENIRYAFILP